MHFSTVAEPYFNFGGVNIDIHTRGVHLQIQHIHRLSVTMKHIFIGTARAMRDDFVSHKAAVHISKLLVRTRSRCIGCAGSAPDMHRARTKIDVDRRCHKLFTQDIGQTLIPTGLAWVTAPLHHDFAFVPNGKAHFRANQGVAPHGFNAMRQFGVFRL